MQNSPEVMQKAKRYLRRYRIRCALFAVCICFGYTFLAITVSAVLALFVFLFVILVGSAVIFKKSILTILTEELDPDTYLATIQKGKLDSRNATWQLNGEFFCGNYQNVINICQQKQKANKTAYHCLVYLANVYFDVGDHENLCRVCEEYKTAFFAETPSKQAKLAKRYPRMTFYDFYLNGDLDACYAFASAPTPILLNQYHRRFCLARLAELCGSEAEARSLYEALATEVGQLNYGKLAAAKLATPDEAIPQQIDLSHSPTEETPLFVTPQRHFIKGLCIGLAVALMIAGTIGLTKTLGAKERYKAEMKAYTESIRQLVEKDHDDVVVLDVFTLKKGEIIIDSMFVCKTESNLLVGCVFLYGEQAEQRYETVAQVSLEELSENAGTPLEQSFSAITSTYRVKSAFYTNGSALPSTYCHLSRFTVNHQTVYFVVTEISHRLAVTVFLA